MNIKSQHKTGKRLISIILSICIAISLMPMYVFASSTSNYVVLGDSISTGYGLSADEKSFAVQLKESYSLDMTMLAEPGATSQDLYNVVFDDANETALKNADVITVTIGGNDMMDALYEYLAVKYNALCSPTPAWTADDVKETFLDSADPDYGSLMMIALLSLTDFPGSDQAKNKSEEIGVNLNAALAKIKALNADVTVIVANQYNPYTYANKEAEPKYDDIVNAFEGGIELLNAQLSDAAAGNGCTFADVYSAINSATANPCNASFSSDSMNLDFHPNAYGHTIINNTLSPYVGPAVTRYTLTVTDGTGSGSYKNDTKADIKANEAPAGKHFKGWQENTGKYNNNFGNAASETTTFTMPASDITVTAIYENHDLKYHSKVPATCTDNGTKEYWQCNVCSEKYSDAAGTQAVTDAELVIAPSGHTYGDWAVDPDNADLHKRTCINCGDEQTEPHYGGAASYFKKAVCTICNEEYGALLTDTTAPEGTISIEDNEWKAFINDITFGLFFNETQDVTIKSGDDSMNHDGYTNEDAPEVNYFISTDALTLDDLKTKSFETYTGPFSIDKEGQYIIYAKITDHAGNTTYINSDGLIIDKTAPSVTGIENGKTYCGPVEVSVADDHLDKVTVNGDNITVNGGKFTLMPKNSIQTIVITDDAQNSITYTVTVNDGHTFTDYVSNNDATCTADGTKTAKCSYCDAENTVNDTGSALGHDWNEPIYTWSEDGRTCSASRTCKTDSTHTENAEAVVTGEESKAATCTENGITTYTAQFAVSWAAEQNQDVADIPATGHGTAVINSFKTATCTKEGYTGDKVCSDCGTILEKGEPIAMTAHDYVNGKCTVCGADDPDYIVSSDITHSNTAAAPTNNVQNTDSSTAQAGDNSDTAQTGDNSNAALWGALILISGGALCSIAVRKRKHSK